MEVIEKLENDKKIKVTRIAGTSAGAIIGALFAARIPIKDIKHHFENTKLIEEYKKPSTS